MYYRLKEPWAFRGWKKLPWAIRAEYGEHRHDAPMFLKKEPFLELMYCNGVEPVELSDELTPGNTKPMQRAREFARSVSQPD